MVPAARVTVATAWCGIRAGAATVGGSVATVPGFLAAGGSILGAVALCYDAFVAETPFSECVSDCSPEFQCMRGCVEDVLDGQEPAESASNYLLCLGNCEGDDCDRVCWFLTEISAVNTSYRVAYSGRNSTILTCQLSHCSPSFLRVGTPTKRSHDLPISLGVLMLKPLLQVNHLISTSVGIQRFAGDLCARRFEDQAGAMLIPGD